jgi:glycosyltransferase involved in cell wall biosynthesis
MRILFISNLFPPFARGGYEQWCEEVALALAARGHTLCILTTPPADPHGATISDAGQPFPIHRLLRTEVEGGLGHTVRRLLAGAAQEEQANLRHVDAVVQGFQPDAGLIWGMWNISRRVPQRLEILLGERLGYYFCDYWPTLPNAYVQRLQEPARRKWLQWGKEALARYFLPRLAAHADVPLRLPHPICVSQAVRDILIARGAAVQDAQVIYGGTALAEPGAAIPPTPGEQQLRLLYLGRLEPIKGVHTVIDSLRCLGGAVPVTLDIVGAGEPDYEMVLRTQVQEHGLEAMVRFTGPVARAQAPHVLAEHDVLIFPSEWEEPFARSVLEGMAAGLTVIGSTTGGTGEILVEGQTGLTFTAGDSQELARQIGRLAQDPALRRRLAANGRSVVTRRFTLQRMVDELEAALVAIAGQTAPAPAQP